MISPKLLHDQLIVKFLSYFVSVFKSGFPRKTLNVAFKADIHHTELLFTRNE